MKHLKNFSKMNESADENITVTVADLIKHLQKLDKNMEVILKSNSWEDYGDTTEEAVSAVLQFDPRIEVLQILN